MSDKIEITIRIPSDAQSHAHTPYMMHGKFVDYCKANYLTVSEAALEEYEKKGLLYPCIRVLYPRELLRRSFRARYVDHKYEYTVRNEWKPLIELDSDIANSVPHWTDKGYLVNIEQGHPLERALVAENPYASDPSRSQFRAWKRYRINDGELNGHKSYKNRAETYYAPWKIFQVNELNQLNTIEENRAAGWRRGWGIQDKQIRQSNLKEFHPFLKIVNSFAYRRYLVRTRTLYSEVTNVDHRKVAEIYKTAAKAAFNSFNYQLWVRFLRKLIGLYESYKKEEKYRLSQEATEHIGRTVQFIRVATGYDFPEVCRDVNGKFNRSLGPCYEDSVSFYAGTLEELFSDEGWDLKQTIGDYFPDGLKKLNEALMMSEHIPNTVSDQLFDELVKEQGKMALAAIRKMHRALNDTELYVDEDIWSGISDLAKSVEVHGKEWLGGEKLEDVMGKLCSLYAINYVKLKQISGIPRVTQASDASGFIDKLTKIGSSSNVPSDRRCGRHLLIAHLVRNYTSHQKGLTGKVLRENLGTIYEALINTLFVLYAAHKKQ